MKIATPSVQKRQLIANLATECPLIVMLVEDSKVNQKMMTYMLRKLGYPCTLAEDGHQVLTILRNSKLENICFDVILMDVNMEGMNGMECTRLIRAEQNELCIRRPYIIAQTANASSESKNHCLESGMDAFLSKPIALDALITALRKGYETLNRS
jgi:CheY-like chemotaxis protein